MKCRKCQDNAVINMRQHHLALCKAHYLEWFEAQTLRFIEKYKMIAPQEQVLVAVSGGKDSLALWDVLQRLEFAADGIYIHLGIQTEIEYSRQSLRCTEEFSRQRGLTLHMINLPESYGESIPEITQRTRRGKDRPCSVCGSVKRYLMNRVAAEKGYDVLVTGHNLDDEVAVLFGNTINWETEMRRRQSPVLPAAPGFARKAKPFCRFYERETAAYALLRSIDYVLDECPFSTGSKSLYYKELLNRLEADSPGAKLRFYLGFLKARKNGLMADQAGAEEAHYDLRCPQCGQLTSTPGLCAFCRLFKT